MHAITYFEIHNNLWAVLACEVSTTWGTSPRAEKHPSIGKFSPLPSTNVMAKALMAKALLQVADCVDTPSINLPHIIDEEGTVSGGWKSAAELQGTERSILNRALDFSVSVTDAGACRMCTCV